MRKLLTVVVVVLTSCATAPVPTKSAVAAPAETKSVPQEVTYEIALPTSIKSYYPNGDLSSSSVMKYDAQGNLLRQETTNGNGVLTEVRIGKAKGNLWRITVTNPQNGEAVSFEDRVLGSQGELLLQTFLSAKEVVQASNEYTFDQGRRTQWLARTGGGGLQAKTVYRYDSSGNNIKTEVYDAAGELTNVFESTFDAQNQLATRRGLNAALSVVELTNFTWKDGRKVKEETLKPILRTFEYSYGEKSAPTGIVSSVRGKTAERQTLEYQWFTMTRAVAP